MYSPKYTISDKLLEQVVKLEIARKEIRQIALSPSIKKKILRQMRLDNMYHVGKILNSDFSREDIKAILMGKELRAEDMMVKLLINYRNAIEFIQAAVHDQYIELDPNILLHINKILLTGWSESWDSGRFRNTTDEVDKRFDTWVNPGKLAKTELDFRTFFYEILTWFKETRYSTHPIIKTGIIIYEIQKLTPFPAGNTITMLAATELMFSYIKYILGGLFPVSKPFSEHQADFIDALTTSIEKQDATTWIEVFVRAVSDEMSNLRDEVYRLQEQKIARRKKKLLGLNDRQAKILRYLKIEHSVARKKYMKMYDVSTMTAYRDLKELVDKGLIIEKGDGRGTFYELVRPLEEEIEENIGKSESSFEDEITTIAKPKPTMVFGSAEEVNLDGVSGDDPFEEYT